ncbi:tRNA pseudouridine(55) synthase TruB, partial [Streptomyces sp. NPDC002486]
MRESTPTPTPAYRLPGLPPEGFTSHDVVAKMRGIARTRRVGH